MSPARAPDVLALRGSPRAGGNSDALLDALLEPARTGGLAVREARLHALAVRPCRACGACAERGRCARRDAMAGWLAALLAARWVVLASPVYFYGFPGPAKAFIDRCQPLWARKHRPPGGAGPVPISPPGRKGFLVAAGASRGKNLFLGLELTARYFFDAIDVAYAGSYAVRGLDSAGDAARLPSALKGAREAGRALFRS